MAQAIAEYKPVKVESPLFVHGISMFGREQDEYATNLTAHALIQLERGRADAGAHELARKMIGLALNLSPRNDYAGPANKILAEGGRPKRLRPEHGRVVFARLLLTRAKILSESGVAKDARLARYFLALSATLVPDDGEAKQLYSEDIKHSGAVDWETITGGLVQ